MKLKQREGSLHLFVRVLKMQERKNWKPSMTELFDLKTTGIEHFSLKK